VKALAFVLLAACTAAPPPAKPCPAPAVVEPAIPPEDAQLAKWKQIAATEDKKPPAGVTASSLVPELLEYLGSPDPVRRDTIAYDVFTAWLRGGVLTDADAKALSQKLVAGLTGEPVFRRTFSALVLGEIVRRDTKQPYLEDDERRGILRAAHDYALRENDLRGHTGANGWAHAAAHTADLLWRLAQLPTFTEADRVVILDTVSIWVTRRHGTVLAYGEDSRLAAPVLAVAKAGVPADALATWLSSLRAPLVEKLTPQFDAGLFAAQRNARNLLFTLYVQLSATKDPLSPGEQALFDGIKKLIAQ
jgi:Protein of unknown function (DUF2785)